VVVLFAGAVDGQIGKRKNVDAFHHFCKLHCARHHETWSDDRCRALPRSISGELLRVFGTTSTKQERKKKKKKKKKIQGNLVLNLWDCGGQEAFMENYFASQREHIFRNVEVLIYVFDVESKDHQKDLRHYRSSLEAIMENSKVWRKNVVFLFLKMFFFDAGCKSVLSDSQDGFGA
jgi:GTPase SAR1 family protein